MMQIGIAIHIGNRVPKTRKLTCIIVKLNVLICIVFNINKYVFREKHIQLLLHANKKKRFERIRSKAV